MREIRLEFRYIVGYRNRRRGLPRPCQISFHTSAVARPRASARRASASRVRSRRTRSILSRWAARSATSISTSRAWGRLRKSRDPKLPDAKWLLRAKRRSRPHPSPILRPILSNRPSPAAASHAAAAGFCPAAKPITKPISGPEPDPVSSCGPFPAASRHFRTAAAPTTACGQRPAPGPAAAAPPQRRQWRRAGRPRRTSCRA